VALRVMGVAQVIASRQLREDAAVGNDAANRDTAESDAVIAAFAADQARTRALSDGALVGDGDLQRRVDRFGTGIGIEDAVEALRGDLRETLGEFEGDRMAHPERRGIVEREQLLLDGAGDLLAAMAGIDAPQACGSIENAA